jgi:hypothetical protein
MDAKTKFVIISFENEILKMSSKNMSVGEIIGSFEQVKHQIIHNAIFAEPKTPEEAKSA